MESDILKNRIIDALKEIFDPEIAANIYDLGLIYQINITDNHDALIQMTLTSPNCPVAQTFPGIVEEKIASLEGIKTAKVELVWDPPWTLDRMKEEIKLELGFL